MRALPRLAFVLLVSLAACGGEEPGDPGITSGWNAVAGMICADGSPTGIGVSPGTQNRVLVYLAGGGACWSATECNASAGPFGKAQFDFYSAFTTGTILDRALPGNPFADWNIVFVPYCTGDVHAGGDVTNTYGAQGTWRHHGRANLEAAFSRIAAAFPIPEKIVVAGSSAGGFGALLAFPIARARWPANGGAKAYLVDDSGQTLVGNDLSPTLRDAWWASWNLDATVTPLCASCKADLSELWTTLSATYPSDRFALLSSTQDATMRGFFGGMDGPTFEAGVATLAAKLAGLPNAESFRIGGADATDHVLLLAPAAYTAAGTSLTSWIGLEVSDSGAWTSVGP